jgi:hypothetical protein
MIFQFYLPLAELGQLGQLVFAQVLTLDGEFLLAVWHEKYVDLQERSAVCGQRQNLCGNWHQM